MKLHAVLSNYPRGSYIVVAIVGATLACGCWFLTGKLFPSLGDTLNRAVPPGAPALPATAEVEPVVPKPSQRESQPQTKTIPPHSHPQRPSVAATAEPQQEPLSKEIAKELAELKKGLTKGPCHLENNQLVDCTDAEILVWGKPLLERLQAAIEDNKNSIRQRHRQYEKDHNDAVLKDWKNRVPENIDLNRYLARLYRVSEGWLVQRQNSQPRRPLQMRSGRGCPSGGFCTCLYDLT